MMVLAVNGSVRAWRHIQKGVYISVYSIYTYMCMCKKYTRMRTHTYIHVLCIYMELSCIYIYICRHLRTVCVYVYICTRRNTHHTVLLVARASVTALSLWERTLRDSGGSMLGASVLP